MKLGIVGSELAKFTLHTEAKARGIIRDLLARNGVTGVVSGGCHLDGVGIFAEQEVATANALFALSPKFSPASNHIDLTVHLSKSLQWIGGGYAPRNLAIARDSDEAHCITVAKLPKTYTGMKFPLCYHCAKEGPGFADVPHVKSGGCWTMHKARKMGKIGVLHVVSD